MLMDEMVTKVLQRAAEKVEMGWCQGWLGEVLLSEIGPTAPRGRHIEGHLPGQERLVVTLSTDALLGKADRVCLDGALIVATAEVMGLKTSEAVWTTLYGQVRDRVTHAMVKASPGVFHQSYVQWNDKSERTADEVAALLRGAAQE